MPTPNDLAWCVVNSTLIGTARVKLLDWSQLVNSAPRRGSNLPMPLADGRRNYPRRPDEKVVQLGVQIDGRFDDDGLPTVGDWAEAATDTLVDLADEDGPLGIGLATVPFEFHLYGIQREADAQVHGIFGADFKAPHIVDVVLELVVPPRLVIGS